MNADQTRTCDTQSFKHFILNNLKNKKLLIIGGVTICIQFLAFKYFYPFASYIHGDSFSYINAAEKNLDINTYPIGYSKFLRLLSVFNRTDYVLNAIQYLLIEFAALFLLFTIFYFNKVSKIIQLVLFAFIICNPLFLHLANLVSSDGLFLSLSLTWFALLLWVIHRPSNTILIWHGIIIFLAFTVRYNAVIYPFIALFAFLLSKLSLKKKLAGLTFAALLIGSFVGFTMYKYKKLTGYWQFSPFSGWQFANNALYAYRFVDSAKQKSVPKRFKQLDTKVKLFYKNTKNVPIFYEEAFQASTAYMWTPGMPLMYYRDGLFKLGRDTTVSEFKKWANMGPLYKDYGLYIIRQYPKEFIRWFIWPNCLKYYSPPVEFLENYNSGKDNVTDQTQKWFGYTTPKIKPRFTNNKIQILNYLPILSGIINFVILLALVYYCSLKGWKYNQDFNKTIFLGSLVWLLNAAFTIVISSAALRFQSFPLTITTTYCFLLIDWMLQVMIKIKHASNDNNVIEERKLVPQPKPIHG